MSREQSAVDRIVDTVFERMERADVRYRLVIDIAGMTALTAARA